MSDTEISIGKVSYGKFALFNTINADAIGFPKMVLKNAVIPTIIDCVWGTDV